MITKSIAMQSFDIKELIAVKNKQGLYKLLAPLKNGLVYLVRFGYEEQKITVKPADCNTLTNYVIFTNEGEVKLDQIFDALFADSIKPDFTADFDKLDADGKKAMMMYYVPNYDDSQFKPHHMALIFKWFRELHNIFENQGAAKV